jgi:hypothetical protein
LHYQNMNYQTVEFVPRNEQVAQAAALPTLRQDEPEHFRLQGARRRESVRRAVGDIDVTGSAAAGSAAVSQNSVYLFSTAARIRLIPTGM